jgi:hypothetical protein
VLAKGPLEQQIPLVIRVASTKEAPQKKSNTQEAEAACDVRKPSGVAALSRPQQHYGRAVGEVFGVVPQDRRRVRPVEARQLQPQRHEPQDNAPPEIRTSETDEKKSVQDPAENFTPEVNHGAGVVVAREQKKAVKMLQYRYRRFRRKKEKQRIITEMKSQADKLKNSTAINAIIGIRKKVDTLRSAYVRIRQLQQDVVEDDRYTTLCDELDYDFLHISTAVFKK